MSEEEEEEEEVRTAVEMREAIRTDRIGKSNEWGDLRRGGDKTRSRRAPGRRRRSRGGAEERRGEDRRGIKMR